MPLQFVGANSAGKAGATSGDSTLSLTALTGGIGSTALAGDIVLAVFSTGGTADRTLAITDGATGYTLAGSELYSDGNPVDTNLRVAYKIMGATPDTTTTFGPTGNAAEAGGTIVHVWRNVDAATPQDVTATTATGVDSALANGAAITPVTVGAIIFVAAGAGTNDAPIVFTASELSNFVTVSGVDSDDVIAGIGSYAWTSGAFNPAAFGLTQADSTSNSWAAVTFALRPATSAIPPKSRIYSQAVHRAASY